MGYRLRGIADAVGQEATLRPWAESCPIYEGAQALASPCAK